MTGLSETSEPNIEFDPANDWRPLFKGNLIYLPFARHLAEEDQGEAEFQKAA